MDMLRQKSKLQLTEVVGEMEVGLFPVDGVPGEEVGRGEFVATLVEVGSHVTALHGAYVAQEIGAERDDKGYLPALGSLALLHITRTER